MSKKKKLKKVGKEEIEKARAKLDRYKAAKQSLNGVIRFNEDWYRQRHTEYVRTGRKLSTTGMEGDTVPVYKRGETVEPVSAWLFNSVQNFHADYMDNYPRCNVLPREQADEEEAYKITKVLPSLLDRIGFEGVYSRSGWTKAIQGWTVYTVTWDKDANDGKGEISVGRAKLLNFYWDMEVDDLERSSDIFYLHEKDREELLRDYPQLADSVGVGDAEHERHENVTVGDGAGKVTVVDWYYKKRNKAGKKVVHFCQFCGEEILYASENDPDMSERGLYDHGRYPFIIDVLYPLEDAVYGFGKIAVGSSKQAYIDILSQAILKNAMWTAVPRYFVKKDYGFNMEDFLNTGKMAVEVEAGGDLNEYVKRIEVGAIDGNALNLQDRMVEELRETTNMRDVSQGSTTGGVTAASGIAALQEAAGKTARDSNRTSFRAFREVMRIVIELIRQFYTEEHFFRVLNEDTGETVYVGLDNKNLINRDGVLFDLEITTEKNSTYSRMAQNELMLSFFEGGFFNPQLADQSKACLRLMDFEGKDEMLREVSENDNRQQVLQALLDYMIQIGQAYDQMSAAAGVESNETENITMMAEQILGTGMIGGSTQKRSNPGESSIMTNAREGAASVATPT